MHQFRLGPLSRLQRVSILLVRFWRFSPNRKPRVLFTATSTQLRSTLCPKSIGAAVTPIRAAVTGSALSLLRLVTVAANKIKLSKVD